MSENINACPFCGRMARFDGERVECHFCHSCGPVIKDRKLAVHMWNTRAASSSLKAALENNRLLRIALLNEWKRLKIDFANTQKPSAVASELEAHIEVIAAVLHKDDGAASSHKWTGVQRGGSPGDAGSVEYVRFCELCGMEDTCEDPLPPCPGREVIATVEAQQALVELKRRHKGEPGWEE